MTRFSPLVLLLLSVLLCGTVFCISMNADVYSHNKIVVCYVASWAAYRPGRGAFTWENVDAGQCSHIVYAFAGWNNETLDVVSLDPFLDTADDGGRNQYAKIQSFRRQHPALKVTLAIGGWNEGSVKYSTMAQSAETRRRFVQQAAAFVRRHGFHGLDMDWEYPGSRMGRPEDRDNFVLLLQELREEFAKDQLLLTVALGAAPATARIGYNVAEIAKYVDLMHLMCYDYHGSWDQQTGHNAPLRLPEGHKLDEDHRFSVEDTLNYYLAKGAPREKIVLGVPFYGRTFTLLDPALHGVGAAATNVGFQGAYTREDGFLGYNEICKELATAAWTEAWDDAAQTAYMYNDTKWVSYDDHRSIAVKARYAFDQQLAGVMVWAIDNDDFDAECSKVRYPLLRTINSELRQATLDAGVLSTPAPEPTPTGGATAATAAGVGVATLLSLAAAVLLH